MVRRICRSWVTVACILALLGNTQCTLNQNNASGSPTFVTSLSVQNASGQPANTFVPGDTLQFVLTVRNRTAASQTLWFNTGEQYNFAVVNAGTANVVWNWDEGQTFDPAFSSFTLGPGESATFTVSWNQTDNNGHALPAGDYEVLGGVTVYNTAGANSAADNTDSMATGTPNASELSVSRYRSILTLFTLSS